MVDIYIENFNIALFLTGILIFVYGFLAKQLRPKLAGFVFSAVNLNSPGTQNFIYDIFGFGFAIPGLILLVLMIILMRPGIYFPKQIFFNGLSLFFIPVLISFVSLSTLKSTHQIESTKSILSLILVIAGGWFLISRLSFATSSINPRFIINFILNYVGVSALILITSLLIIAGPQSLNRMIGGEESLINFFGVSVSRLQLSGFNATGVGATSAFGLFWAYWRLSSTKDGYTKTISLIMMLIFLLSLLWSGSRGALAAFVLTIAFFSFLRTDKNYFSLKRTFKFVSIILPMISIVGFFLFLNLERGSGSGDSISIIQLYISGRISNEGPLLMDLLSSAGLFGHGYGSLAMGQGTDRLSVESFWPRVVIELGLLGSFFYTLFFLLCTMLTVKADRRYQKEIKEWAYLPTAFIMLIWFNSITSWGFSSPNASLLIVMIVFSCSYYSLMRYPGIRSTYVTGSVRYIRT